MRLMRPGSFFDGEMSPDVAGGVATLFVLTRFAGHSPAFAEKYWQIYEYIGSHPEAQKIYSTVETMSPLPEAAGRGLDPQIKEGRYAGFRKTIWTNKCAAKFYSFVLLGESEARRRSFRDMMRIICERCPNGK